MIPQQLKARFADLDRLTATTQVPEPWTRVGVLAVGGLTHVGFAQSSDLLLVMSSAGRGVCDCRSAVLEARDDSDDFRFDIGNLLADGIGPLAGTAVRMCGMFGGGLASKTDDGWMLERHPLSWPDDEFFLSPPGQTMLWQPAGQPLKLTKLAGFVAEIRAFGFAPTGQSFIIATASDIAIFARSCQ